VAKLSRQDREAIARRRILSVLTTQVVATTRTIEQKIADAGPGHLRIDPHILTPVKARLIREGRVVSLSRKNAQWLHVAEESPDRVARRLSELTAIWSEFTNKAVTDRMGDALEIAVFRAMVAADGVTPFNGFHDLNTPNDRGRYSKEELKTFNGRSLGREALDFIAAAGGEYAGIEVKNVREWLYPDRAEIKNAIRKALALGVIPVIVARRIPYVTFHVLGRCGVVMHQNYNQLMSEMDREIAAKAADKNLLGYHDLRVGDEPDRRMTKFIGENLPSLLPKARAKVEEHLLALERFATNAIEYNEFVAITGGRKSEGWQSI